MCITSISPHYFYSQADTCLCQTLNMYSKGLDKRYAHFSIIIIIITLFESQIILAEHECCTNWGDCKSNMYAP